MALNTLKCNHLTPQRSKGLNVRIIDVLSLCLSCWLVSGALRAYIIAIYLQTDGGLFDTKPRQRSVITAIWELICNTSPAHLPVLRQQRLTTFPFQKSFPEILLLQFHFLVVLRSVGLRNRFVISSTLTNSDWRTWHWHCGSDSGPTADRLFEVRTPRMLSGNCRIDHRVTQL